MIWNSGDQLCGWRIEVKAFCGMISVCSGVGERDGTYCMERLKDRD